MIRKTYRYRVYPTAEQVARLERWQDALRFLWNLAQEQRLLGLARPRCERRYPTAFDQINELTELRAALPWLADVPRHVCGQLLVELDLAWQRCFKKLARQPRWKKKGRDVLGLYESDPKQWYLDGQTLRFPKLGLMRLVLHRPLEGKPKTCILIRDVDQWFACISVEMDADVPTTNDKPAVALDRGIVNFVADSDGSLVPGPRHLEHTMRRLAHAQRVVSRRKKGSRNRDKAKLRVAKLHRKVRRQRNHFLHCLSNRYANSHGTVIVERLHIQGMVQSNRGLARSIHDAGWGRFVTLLRCKLLWTGGRLVEVPAAYSSQTCSACGCVDAASRRTQAAFRCTTCGHTDHADLNAAKVLLLRGTAVESTVAACGGSAEVGRPKRQELRVVRRGPRLNSGSQAPEFRLWLALRPHEEGC